MTMTRLLGLIVVLLIGVLFAGLMIYSPPTAANSIHQHLVDMQRAGDKIGIVQPGGDAPLGSIKEVGADYVCEEIDEGFMFCQTFDRLQFVAIKAGK